MTAKRVYAAVALCAVVVYLGALWNKFALDDLPIIALNPLVVQPGGIWRAFTQPYWSADFGGHMYRPLVIAGFALDALVDGTAWFHAVNLLWHAAASVAVAALARQLITAASAADAEPRLQPRLAGGTSDTWVPLIAGLLFAVHPVHVEAVANVVGRAELMATLFTVLAVHAALAGRHPAWSAAALGFGLLSKENAAVAPALVVWAWMLGIDRPDRRRMVWLLISWVIVGAAYAGVRTIVRQPFGGNASIAPMFVGQSPLTVRLTAVAALADVARLLVFPLTLRVDYSPNERTAVTSLIDLRFAAGLFCAVVWAALLVVAWQRGRKIEAFGLGWIGVGFLPVANLLYPAGFYVAERTLYLPSAGLVLAATAALARLPRERLRLVVATLCLLGGIRTALRVPKWRDDHAVTESILDDSPESYGGYVRMAGVYLERRDPARALATVRIAAGIMDRDPWVYAIGSVAAFAAGDPGAADSLIVRLERFCSGVCAAGYLRYEATMARAHGYPEVADSLLAKVERLRSR